MESMTSKVALSYLENKNIHAHAVESNPNILKGSFSFKGGSLTYFLDFHEDDEHLHVEALDIAKVPEDKKESMYKALNEINASYNFVKFILNESRNDIIVRADAIIQLDSCGAETYELLIRTVKIVESAYPTIMKAVWS